jgi:aryl-alcohol dehydrogenase-like predicted oxidoreductase
MDRRFAPGPASSGAFFLLMNNDPKMSPIGFGTWPLGGRAYGPVEESVAVAAIEKALELGIRLFDTANIYGDGRAEELLGRTISGLDNVIIISKVGYLTEVGSDQDFSESHMRYSVEGSLRRLRRNKLEALLLHSPTEDVLLQGEAFKTLSRFKQEGIVEQTGVSLRTLDSFEAVIDHGDCTMIELILNLLDQRPIDKCLLQRAMERNIQIIARVPLCFGLLSGGYQSGHTFASDDQRSRWPHDQLDKWIMGVERFRFLEQSWRSMTQAALAFCIGVPGVSYAIPGMKTPEQVEHNVVAGNPLYRLTSSEMSTTRHLWQDLKHIPPQPRSN